MSDDDTPDPRSTAAAPAPRGSRFVDLTPLRLSPPYARIFVGQSVASIGAQLTLTAAALNVYALTRSTFAVSLVGVVALIPTVLAGLYGGMIADAFDRKKVAVGSALVSWASTGTIAFLSWTGAESAISLYVLTAITAVAATVLAATQSAILPRLLPRNLLPAAAALNGITFGIAVTVGPALAGVLVAAAGFQWCYTIDVTLFVAALAGILSLPSVPPAHDAERPSIASLLGGIAFLRGARNLRTSFLVDIVAMTFGQPRVLFPAAGALLLGGGAITVGALSAAFAIGALVSGLLSGRLGEVRLQGRAVERAIVVYGACIAGFGVVLAVTGVGEVAGWLHSASPADPDIAAIGLAAVLLAGAGAADNVSAIFRSTMLQSAAPDNVRGRLQGVFIVVVTGGPRVGDLYVGLLAASGALWLPPLAGGVVIAVLVMLLARRHSSSFLRYDAVDPVP